MKSAVVCTGFLIASILCIINASNVKINADLHGKTADQSYFMLECIGASHGEMSMWEDNRNHLRSIARDIGFTHIRGHGLLNDDLSVFLNGKVNMHNLYSIMDFYLSINMRPIFELSFTPSELAKNASQEMMHYRAINSPAKDMNKWHDFVFDVISSFVDRYGVEEVRKWRFEFYNEPNCGFFAGSPEEWYAMYNASAVAVKNVDAGISIGGPATAGLGGSVCGSEFGELTIEQFLNYCHEVNAPVDMVTTHLYPTDGPATVPEAAGRDGFAEAIKGAAANATKFGGADMPLTITEFNAGLGLPFGRDLDAPYAAAFVVHNHFALQGVRNLDTLSYWSYSDLFEEQGMDSLPYQNEALSKVTPFGIMNVNGVPKPVYRAFQMLAELPKSTVPVTAGNGTTETVVVRPTSISVGDIDVTVAVDADTGKVTALVTNYALFSSATAVDQEVTIVFDNVEGVISPAGATLERIDSLHANPRSVWLAAGSPKYCSPTQIASEMVASQLKSEPIQMALLGKGTETGMSYMVTLTLEAFSVARIQFSIPKF